MPDVSARPKEPNAKDRKFEDVVNSAERAATLVLVYRALGCQRDNPKLEELRTARCIRTHRP